MNALCRVGLASLFVSLFLVACGSPSDVSIGKTNQAASGDLKEGDECPAEKCADDGVACAATEDGTQETPTNLRCVAGPQVGSGVGVCHLVGECGIALEEGDVCPAEKCANSGIACAPSDDATPRVPANVRCVAGPQVGSGVGVCNLVGDCVPAP